MHAIHERTTGNGSGHVKVAPPGLKGVVISDTSVGDVRGEEGFYHYGPYSAVDLARRRSVEDVWYLLFHGRLPDRAEGQRFAADVARRRRMPPALEDLLTAVARGVKPGHPLDGLRTALSGAAAVAGMRPIYDLTAEQRRDDAMTLCALTPSLVAALHRLGSGRPVVPSNPELSFAADYLWMLTGREPAPEEAEAIRTYLVSTIDHGFNASTFAARVVASTGADMGACVTAGVAALSGPLHGGAPSRALDLLDEIGSPERVDAVLAPRIAAGERVMGFGHAVYRTDDPRSLLLREVARRLGGPTAELAEAVERRVVELLEAHKPGRRLRTNVEFYAGVVMDACGIPRELFTPTFATSRVIGWCAHVLEQAAQGTIIRPSARYVGPPAPQPVPEA